MWENLKLFIPYFKPYQKLFWLGSATLILSTLLDLVLPLLIGFTVGQLNSWLKHEITAGQVSKHLLYVVLIYLGIMLVLLVTRYVYSICFGGMGCRIARDMRNEFFNHIQSLSLNFFNTTRTGDIMSRATSDIKAVRMFYEGGLFAMVDCGVLLLVVPAIMFWISPKLTLYLLAFLPFIPIVVTRLGKLVRVRFKEIQGVLAQISSQAQENFAGVRVVKSYVQEDNQIRDFNRLNLVFLGKNMGVIKVFAAMGPLLGALIGLGSFLVVLIGGMQVIDGQMSLAAFVSFQLYLFLMLWPIMGLGEAINVYQQASASMARLKEILDIKPEIKSPASAVKRQLAGRIEFRNLSHTFVHEKRPALKNINLSIPAGSLVAILGPLGSGKTSLAHLVPRLFDPDRGEVLIDDINVKEYDLNSLRQQIGYAPQDLFLFSDTIRENIALGLDEEVDLARVVEASQIAQLHEFIDSLPEKYETILGERGVNLSGGQKQRLTLARAIIKNPRILILDDCFSSVDVDTETEILQRLREVFRKRTNLVVSHRIPVVRLADMIVFMEDGKIIELGSHPELMSQRGRYAKFYEYQQVREDWDRKSD